MRVLISLAILVTVALLASSRRWWTLRRTPIGAAMVTGGWLAVGLGLLLGPHAVTLVDAQHVMVLRPLILFCLGWVGLMVGMQLRRDLPTLLPAGTFRLTFIDFAASLLIITAAAVALFALGGQPISWQSVAVLSALLGACGVGWSAEMRSLTGSQARLGQPAGVLRAGAGLGSVLSVMAYGLVFMVVKPGPEAALAGVTLAVGLGVSALVALVVGLMSMWLMRLVGRSDSEFLVVLLGLVSFAAGAAATMGYSPLFVGMLCGMVMVNLPGDVLLRFRRVILEAEQPVAMALMLTAGVLADPNIGLMGWGLVMALVAARLPVKLFVVNRCIRRFGQARGDGPVNFVPLRQAPLAIALGVGYAISAHAEATSGAMDAGRLLMVIILVGLVTDIAPQALRLLRGEEGHGPGDTIVEPTAGEGRP